MISCGCARATRSPSTERFGVPNNSRSTSRSSPVNPSRSRKRPYDRPAGLPALPPSLNRPPPSSTRRRGAAPGGSRRGDHCVCGECFVRDRPRQQTCGGDRTKCGTRHGARVRPRRPCSRRGAARSCPTCHPGRCPGVCGRCVRGISGASPPGHRGSDRDATADHVGRQPHGGRADHHQLEVGGSSRVTVANRHRRSTHGTHVSAIRKCWFPCSCRSPR